MNKGGFSWKRFLGVSAAKSRISRKTGIPFTRSGRHQKIGRIATGGGCLIPVLGLLVGAVGVGLLAYLY
jgi:hypothetical protein